MTCTMSDPSVCNSSCLIVLDAIGHLDLLRQLFGTITIPDAVAAEFGNPLPQWFTLETVQNRAAVKSLQLQLGPGESEAIALASELTAVRDVLDDKKARRIARQLDLPVTGTVALLIQARQRGLIANLRDAFDQLRAAGFFLADSLADAALRQVGE
jgi:predicted nucleic acid-binding protein